MKYLTKKLFSFISLQFLLFGDLLQSILFLCWVSAVASNKNWLLGSHHKFTALCVVLWLILWKQINFLSLASSSILDKQQQQRQISAHSPARPYFRNNKMPKLSVAEAAFHGNFQNQTLLNLKNRVKCELSDVKVFLYELGMPGATNFIFSC